MPNGEIPHLAVATSTAAGIFVNVFAAESAGGRRIDGKEVERAGDRTIRWGGNGLTSKQIAGRLHLSAKTIERYKENIERKLSISNATELVQKAARWLLEKG